MAGKKFGRFEIRSLLGKGAMGAVYSAHDPMLNRDVAIKIVRFPEHIDAAVLEKTKQNLLREAQLAARLSHPGIVQVYDAGEQGGQPFIVLERIRGQLLSDRLKEMGALDPETAGPIFKKLLEAMAYAHKKGIVHLDLKPANIMIGNNAQPRVMDFGIARTISDLMEQHSEIRGTPNYMAPEQVLGKALDPRTDVFSLGVIFYLMLSGHLPFSSKDLKDLLHRIPNEPHQPLQSLQSDLPKAFYDFIDRALSKSPMDRFESAAEMIESYARDLEPAQAKSASGDTAVLSLEGRQEILRFIQQRMKRKGDFPSVSQYVSEVVRAARSPNSSASSIAQSILKDVSLTNRVLRMANSAFYRGYGSAITTISRAVVVLGMDTILNMTSALGIFEHFLKNSSVEGLKKQVLRALFTALNARAVAVRLNLENSEEPFICGMLHHLGRLIVSFYFPEEQAAIETLVRVENMTEEQASREVMRLSYSELSQGIAESWNLPGLLQSGIMPMDPSQKGPLKGKEETLKGVTAYAYELGDITMIKDPEEQMVAIANLTRKFQGKINLRPKTVQQMVKDSLKDAAGFSKVIRVGIQSLGLATEEDDPAVMASKAKASKKKKDPGTGAHQETVSRDGCLPAALHPPEKGTEEPEARNGDADTVTGTTRDRQMVTGDSDFKLGRQEYLTKTIGDIAITLTGHFSISDIIMMILEGMFRGLGMDNVFLAMISPGRDMLAFRFGLGAQVECLRTEFNYSLKEPNSALAEAINNRAEVAILDFDRDPVKKNLPGNLIKTLAPRSLIMVPLVVKDSTIGLFVASRSQTQPPINELDLQSVRMLVNQCVLALHQSSVKR